MKWYTVGQAKSQTVIHVRLFTLQNYFRNASTFCELRCPGRTLLVPGVLLTIISVGAVIGEPDAAHKVLEARI